MGTERILFGMVIVLEKEEGKGIAPFSYRDRKCLQPKIHLNYRKS